jgi:hypothetical protein
MVYSSLLGEFCGVSFKQAHLPSNNHVSPQRYSASELEAETLNDPPVGKTINRTHIQDHIEISTHQTMVNYLHRFPAPPFRYATY